MDLIIFLVVGALAGYVAGLIMKGGGFGVLINIVVGIVGAWLGGWLIGKWIPAIVAIGPVTLGSFITAVIGACLLLWIISFFKK